MRCIICLSVLAIIAGCETSETIDVSRQDPTPRALAMARGEAPARASIDMGPPPPGYVRILGGAVPNWRPEHMTGLRDGPRSPLTWEPLGPRPITEEYWSGDGDASGRVVGVAPHPVDPEIVYIATASGGVWKTTDGGAMWTPMTDEMACLNHGAIAIDPTDPETVYAGTGEYTVQSRGDGLFRSTDGGALWERIATADQVGSRFSGVCVDATNPLVIHATTNVGYVRSTDGGATWSVLLAGSASGLAVNPDDPSRLFVGRHNDGVYRSIDGGGTWARCDNGLPPGGAVDRIIVAVASSTPDIVYAAMTAGQHIQGLYRTTNGGDDWVQLVNTPDFAYPQAWYDMYVAVDPTDADTVYCGGVSPIYANAGIIKSTDGGQSWVEISAGALGGQTHPDHHFMAFGPTGIVWESNDGGVWKSLDGGLSWINCNGTLAVTQQYTVGGMPQDGARVLGGTQDNGSIERMQNDEAWPQVIGGDGGFLAYDFIDPAIKYTTYVRLSVQRWINGVYADISGPWQNEPRNFIAPLVMDPNNSHTLLGGTNRVWRTTNAPAQANWQPVSGTEVAGGGTLNTLAVAVGASETVYTGSSTGRVFVTHDLGEWNDRSGGLPPEPISDITIDPTDPAHAYVSYYSTNGGRIFRSEDYGHEWSNVTGDLPDGVGVTALAVDWRTVPPGLYIGTGAGVWSSHDGGATWIKDENDLPNVNIGDLQINPLRLTLIAGTYGRGTWRANLPATLQCPTDVNGDSVVDVLDLLAVLAVWGAPGGPEDINGDGVVNVLDMLEVLADWGPCPGDPVGACCTPDGACNDTGSLQCVLTGGDWFEGEACATFTCPPLPVGACCYYPSGDCVELTEWECGQSDGTWEGPGTVCATTECPTEPLGACCLYPFSDCLDLAEWDCAVAGGQWQGAGSACATTECPAAPPGDAMNDPFPIEALPYSTVGDTSGFGDDYDEACPFTGISAPDVVYAFMPAADVTVTISLCENSAYDTKLYVYENEEGNLIGCNEDSCSTPSFPNPWVSELTGIQMLAGNTYYIIVDGYPFSEGAYTLDVHE